ncbi:MAG: flagellar assembly protein FliW [Candidatus Gastranaerophilales bacterium]|nr:flagellar assembly protein FliW [Candidatus Gastranaerophilales bacterium]
MIINTSRFGEVEIDENLIFDFVEPILGYENLKKFVLIDHMQDSPFKWLQSSEDENIAFPVTIAGYFGLDYEFVIPEEEAKKLELINAEELLTLNIVCIPSGEPEAATINLAAPVVINTGSKKGMQLILSNANYAVRQKLFADGIKQTVKS